MIKAIIFDFFGVIRSDDLWRFIKRDRITDVLFNQYAQEVNSGSISWQEFIQKVAKASKRDVPELEAMYAAEAIDPLVVGLIHKLHKKYKTGLLTNASAEYIEPLLVNNHLDELFDSVVVSSRLGVVKPDRRIFEASLKELDVKPNEAIYIDDLARHIDGADAIGMHGIVYKDFKQMRRELDRLLADSND